MESEKGEIGIISAFLPKQMNEAETLIACKEAIKLVKAEGPKDIGKVMAILKTELQGRADMGEVSRLIKTKLSD